MCLCHCEGDVGEFRLVVPFRKIVGAADSLYARRPGGCNVIVAISPFAPPGAAVGVLTGSMSTIRDLARLHCFVGAVCVDCSGVFRSAVAVVHHPADGV